MASFGKHTRSPGWKPGSHWVECDRCGFDYRSEDILTEWTGLAVCEACWEPRHPQDFVRGVGDDMSAPPPVRPTDPQETDICTTQSAVAGVAIAGCAIAGQGLDYTIPEGTFTNSL